MLTKDLTLSQDAQHTYVDYNSPEPLPRKLCSEFKHDGSNKRSFKTPYDIATMIVNGCRVLTDPELSSEKRLIFGKALEELWKTSMCMFTETKAHHTPKPLDEEEMAIEKILSQDNTHDVFAAPWNLYKKACAESAGPTPIQKANYFLRHCLLRILNLDTRPHGFQNIVHFFESAISFSLMSKPSDQLAVQTLIVQSQSNAISDLILNIARKSSISAEGIIASIEEVALLKTQIQTGPLKISSTPSDMSDLMSSWDQMINHPCFSMADVKVWSDSVARMKDLNACHMNSHSLVWAAELQQLSFEQKFQALLLHSQALQICIGFFRHILSPGSLLTSSTPNCEPSTPSRSAQVTSEDILTLYDKAMSSMQQSSRQKKGRLTHDDRIEHVIRMHHALDKAESSLAEDTSKQTFFKDCQTAIFAKMKANFKLEHNLASMKTKDLRKTFIDERNIAPNPDIERIVSTLSA